MLRPGGRFAFFLNHPLLQTPNSGWIDDHMVDPPEQYWRIGPYLVEDNSVEEVEKDVFIPFIHRPMSRYVNAMADAGLVLRRMLEPAPPPGFLGGPPSTTRRRRSRACSCWWPSTRPVTEPGRRRSTSRLDRPAGWRRAGSAVADTPMCLSHHWPTGYDRCAVIGGLHVCRRCLVLYPVALVAGVAISLGSWWPDGLDPWVLWLFPLPGRDRVRARQPRPHRVLDPTPDVALGRRRARRRRRVRQVHRGHVRPAVWAVVGGVHRDLRGRRDHRGPPQAGASPRDQRGS